MIRQRMIAGLVAATALVGLTACGSDSKSSSTTAAKATTTSAATATTKAATATTAAGSATTTKTGSATTLPGGITVPDITTPAVTGECVQLQKDLPDLSATTNFSTEDVNKAFTTLKSKVPADLKDDVDTIKKALQPFYDAVQKAGGDATKAMQDPAVLKEAQAAFTDPDFTSATQALDDWFTKGCPSS